ncbi:hypothetical protein FQZ97_1221480 [compost metagenome]
MKRPAAARSTMAPPGTEPVKDTCWIAGAWINCSVSAWLRCRYWNTPSGRPASAKAATMRSAHSGVCAECLSSTALPASSAGITAFTAVR